MDSESDLKGFGEFLLAKAKKDLMVLERQVQSVLPKKVSKRAQSRKNKRKNKL